METDAKHRQKVHDSCKQTTKKGLQTACLPYRHRWQLIMNRQAQVMLDQAVPGTVRRAIVASGQTGYDQ